MSILRDISLNHSINQSIVFSNGEIRKHIFIFRTESPCSGSRPVAPDSVWAAVWCAKWSPSSGRAGSWVWASRSDCRTTWPSATSSVNKTQQLFLPIFLPFLKLNAEQFEGWKRDKFKRIWWRERFSTFSEHLLRVPLTVVDAFHSHLEPLHMLEDSDLPGQVTFSYSNYRGNRMNRVSVAGWAEESDPTRFLSLYCRLTANEGQKNCPAVMTSPNLA